MCEATKAILPKSKSSKAKSDDENKPSKDTSSTEVILRFRFISLND